MLLASKTQYFVSTSRINLFSKNVLVKSTKSRITLFLEYAPQTQFIFIRELDKKIIGVIQIRHYLNEFFEKYGGNVFSDDSIKITKGNLENAGLLTKSIIMKKNYMDCLNYFYSNDLNNPYSFF